MMTLQLKQIFSRIPASCITSIEPAARAATRRATNLFDGLLIDSSRRHTHFYKINFTSNSRDLNFRAKNCITKIFKKYCKCNFYRENGKFITLIFDAQIQMYKKYRFFPLFLGTFQPPRSNPGATLSSDS